jgi:hypothetical protein
MFSTAVLWTRSALLVVAVWYASWPLLLGIYSASSAACPSVDVPCPAQYWIEKAGLTLISAAASVGSMIAAHLAGREHSRFQLGLWYLVLVACAFSTGTVTWSWIPVAVGLPGGLLTVVWLSRSDALIPTRSVRE